MDELGLAELQSGEAYIDYEAMDEEVRFLQLCMGFDDNHEECFALLSLKPSQSDRYYEMLNQGLEIDLKDFGEILYQETGHSIPSTETQEFLKTEFGFDFELEGQMIQMIENMQ